MGEIIFWIRVLPHRGVGSGCNGLFFYWLVARGSPDGQESVDDVDRGFRKKLVN